MNAYYIQLASFCKHKAIIKKLKNCLFELNFFIKLVTYLLF